MYNYYYNDLKNRIEKNYKRLSSSHYGIYNIFRPIKAEWHGDFEGRALLAFVCHYEINGKKIQAMDYFINNLPKHLNYEGYFGEVLPKNYAVEQDLAGNSWFLRGLCEYYRVFKDENILKTLQNIIDNLYINREVMYLNYPIVRNKKLLGGVSGIEIETIGGWKLSSDVGCAFIALDGITDAYAILNKNNIKILIDNMIEKFVSLDFIAMNCQTHATLTATRGIMRMYELTKDEYYFKISKKIFELYLSKGMTFDYENYNWFGRENTWTEPCAIVDSFILSIKFYESTKNIKFLKLARRIYINGLNFCFRSNGGAGTNSCVNFNQHILQTGELYEADFCCTMRYAECLKYANKYFPLIFKDYLETSLIYDQKGRYFKGDTLYCVNLANKTNRLKAVPRALNFSKNKLLKMRLQVVFENDFYQKNK